MFVQKKRGVLRDERKMGRSTRFELATPGTTIQCSNQLSYDRHRKSNLALRAISKPFSVVFGQENRGFSAVLLYEIE